MGNFIESMFYQFTNTTALDAFKMMIMLSLGAILVYLAVEKEMEPSLLLPLGFGTILVNLPFTGAISQTIQGHLEVGPLDILYIAGIANELFPLLLFIGIGAMIDFGPLLANPHLLFFGAAAHLGVFLTLLLGTVIGTILPGSFSLQDAAAVASIGTADGPTAIFVSNFYNTQYMGAILVAAYSYMALVPIIQPPCIRLVTTKEERLIRMPYATDSVSRSVRIIFPVVVTIIAGLVAPRSVGLVGFLMFGNLLRECGVVNSLSETAQNAMTNTITLILGLSVSVQMHYASFLTFETLLVLALGLFAFVADTISGVLFAKFVNLFLKTKVNPMIGGCGISAFPMSSRVVHKMGLEEDPQNFLLIHAAGVNVAGQVASVIVGGLLLGLIPK